MHLEGREGRLPICSLFGTLLEDQAASASSSTDSHEQAEAAPSQACAVAADRCVRRFRRVTGRRRIRPHRRRRRRGRTGHRIGLAAERFSDLKVGIAAERRDRFRHGVELMSTRCGREIVKRLNVIGDNDCLTFVINTK